MPYPKRLRLRRMQVQWRVPNRFERGPLDQDYHMIRWSAQLDEREDGRLVVRLTARTRPTRADVLQAVICLVIRQWPDCSISDLMDLAGCSRETAHRRKLIGYKMNAEYDAQLAAREAVARRRPSRVLSSSP